MIKIFLLKFYVEKFHVTKFMKMNLFYHFMILTHKKKFMHW